MALRRWKPFMGTFALIDTAIEAADADGVLSRDEFRSARARIVELLCDADGDEKVEGLCALLDEAMAESLATLRMVPADKNLLASGDLVGAVAALMTEHASGSGRVRDLARDVVREWRAAAKAEVARATAVLDALPSTPPPPAPQHDTELKKQAAKIPEEQPRPRKTGVVSSRRVSNSTAEPYGPSPKTKAPIVSTSNAKPSANTKAPALVAVQPKKTLPAVVNSVAVAEEEKKMEAAKRRLHDRYQEAEDAKRRRTIQVIKAPRRPPPETTRTRQ